MILGTAMDDNSAGSARLPILAGAGAKGGRALERLKTTVAIIPGELESV
jgi:hypothetical protein